MVFSWSFNIKFSKISRMNRKKIEIYSTSEKHYEPIQHSQIYTIFTQQQDTNSIQVPVYYKPGDTGTYPEI